MTGQVRYPLWKAWATDLVWPAAGAGLMISHRKSL